MYAVQAEGCAPIVKAFAEGQDEAPMWEGATTHAHGLRVPKALGDFLMLKALRAEPRGRSRGLGGRDRPGREGRVGPARVSSWRPEGGACVAALRKLKASGHLSPDDAVVVFNTGTGFKYVENMAPLWGGR